MKEIKAYLRPHRLDVVLAALEAGTVRPGVTVTEVRAYGHPKGGGRAEPTRRVKLEVVILDEHVEEVVRTIVEHAHTGNYGDGILFVSDVSKAVRIRTGERDQEALQHPEY